MSSHARRSVPTQTSPVRLTLVGQTVRTCGHSDTDAAAHVVSGYRVADPEPKKGTNMTKALLKLQTAARSEKGATAVEYGLLVALIAAVIVGVVGFLGTEISTAFQDVLTAIQAN